MASLDPRWLGMFMILSTQAGWARQLLDTTIPKYEDTDFYKSGLDSDIGNLFEQRFGQTTAPSSAYQADLKDLANSPTQREMYLRLFNFVAKALADSDPTYKPPACPRPETLTAVIAHLNAEQAAILHP
jgi:hypothetical protein